MELGPLSHERSATPAGTERSGRPDGGPAPIVRGTRSEGTGTLETDATAHVAGQKESGETATSESGARRQALPLASRVFRSASWFGQLLFSSLTKRILFVNLSALAALLSGILYLNQFREGLVEAYRDSLEAQGKIIAAAIASSATVETNAITVDPDKLLELEAGESAQPRINSLEELGSPIDPEVVAPLLTRLIQPTRTRARIYDQDGVLILDTRFLYLGGQVLRYDLPPANAEKKEGMISRIGNLLNRWLQRTDLPAYVEHANSGLGYPEVVSALTGAPSTFVRMTEKGEQIISVAVPIQKLRIVSGALLLSSEGNEIDRIVTAERLAILRIFLVAAIVIIVASIILAGTIANPLRRLSEAANKVRQGVDRRTEIPDFGNRRDEIGMLSTSIRSMTEALYSRIEAIERFAADVSHELKNPLTSLRSAVETLPLARTEESKERLHAVIQHDVRRLDRLITDISDASRLDAELAREKSEEVDLREVAQNVASMCADVNPRSVKISFASTPARAGPAGFLVRGHEERLARVIINLVDNAKSFVAEGTGEIDIRLAAAGETVRLTVEDNGPGIPEGNLERIFERFYTDRPESQGFGQNSGLGLSISRQIIEAHGGSIVAENRSGRGGARFIVTLPALSGRRRH